MNKLNSFTLFIMGAILILVAKILDHGPLQWIAIAASIILSIIAVVKSFKEKKNNE